MIAAILLSTACTTDLVAEAEADGASHAPQISALSCPSKIVQAAPQEITCSVDFVDEDADVHDVFYRQVRDAGGALYYLLPEMLEGAEGKPSGTASFTFELRSEPSRGPLTVEIELMDVEGGNVSNALSTTIMVTDEAGIAND